MSTLVYDGDCGICERSADFARRRSRSLIVRDHRSHGLDRIDAVIFTDGTRESTGAPAVAAALATFDARRWRILGRVIDAPLVRVLARWVYALVARNRSRISRLLGVRACGLPAAGSATPEG